MRKIIIFVLINLVTFQLLQAQNRLAGVFKFSENFQKYVVVAEHILTMDYQQM